MPLKGVMGHPTTTQVRPKTNAYKQYFGQSDGTSIANVTVNTSTVRDLQLQLGKKL